ncbi:MAG: NlpC/P60 family protein [Desulfuromonadales bacterium]|nr:NlpC/P60 family protein [Desulfuromonadales bacterium]
MLRFCKLCLIASVIFIFAVEVYAAPLEPAKGISRLGYSIQVGAFSDVKNAERLSSKLQEKGIDAFYFRKESGVYVVRFGDYKKRAAAVSAARKLVAENYIGSYFIASPHDNVFVEPQKVGENVKHGTPESAPTSPQISNVKGNDRNMGVIAAKTAERFVGIPYLWGGNTVVDGMDCSGFVKAVYNLCGVNIPRTSAEQFKVGTPVEKSELAPGDLLFFGATPGKVSHVAIYIGDGKFVQAPKRGDDIKISLLSEKYYTSHYIGAKRYFK